MNALETMKGLREFVAGLAVIRDRSNYHDITAWVMVWYPQNDNIGHVSLCIKYMNDGEGYVSWWPEKPFKSNADFFKKVKPVRNVIFKDTPGEYYCAGEKYSNDCYSEGGTPHVIYAVKNLDVEAMRKEWNSIINKEKSSFCVVSKNCAKIVSRVLKAGAKNSKDRGRMFGFFDGDYYIWTPKRIAVICNILRDEGKAIKIIMPGRRAETSLVKRITRLR